MKISSINVSFYWFINKKSVPGVYFLEDREDQNIFNTNKKGV